MSLSSLSWERGELPASEKVRVERYSRLGPPLVAVERPTAMVRRVLETGSLRHFYVVGAFSCRRMRNWVDPLGSYLSRSPPSIMWVALRIAENSLRRTLPSTTSESSAQTLQPISAWRLTNPRLAR